MATSLCDIEWEEGKPTVPLTVITKMCSTPEHIKNNLRVNMKRDLFRFLQLPGILYARNQPLAIVAGGPSTNLYLDKIKTFEHVMVCGSAHDHLVNMGVPFNFAIAVDPNEDSVNWIQKPQERTSYLIASQCHPNLFEKLEGHKVAMWNFKGQVDEEDEYIFNGEPQINWGPMIGTHSIQMALYLGFQHLHFFGFDCSFIGEEHHAYDVGKYNEEEQGKRLPFNVNGREFISTMGFLSQIEHFFDIFASSDGKFLKGYVYGDGMLANVIKASPPEMKEWLEAA